MDNKTIYYRPLPPRPATLLILERGKQVRLVSLVGSMSIGRESTEVINDISLQSGIVSRNHGEFIYEDSDGSYYYRDNNSLNGTFYNGRKLERLNDRGTRAVKLFDGDVLRIDCDNLLNPRSDAVVLVFSTKFEIGETWHRYSLYDKNTVNIGRNCQDGIALTDFMASRNHAVLNRMNGSWYISDCGSINGLAVNRNMVEGHHPLNIFDLINIANTTLIYLGNEIIYNDVHLNSKKRTDAARSVLMGVNISEVKASHAFTKKVLLSNINLDIDSDDFVLILGGSGAGKTTFIRSIMGDNKPGVSVNGRVMFEDMDLYKNFKMVKHKIGFVPQFPTTRNNDSVYNTIKDTANTKLPGDYTKAEINQRIDQVMERLMLTNLKNNLVGTLSGGQRKRLEVACQAVGNAKLFILDEPDSGMDYATRVDLMTKLKSCMNPGDVDMIITHYPDDVATLFTKVIVLAKSQRDEVGRLAYYGDVQNAYSFFGVKKLSDIVMEINYEGGKGRADEFIDKYERTRRG